MCKFKETLWYRHGKFIGKKKSKTWVTIAFILLPIYGFVLLEKIFTCLLLVSFHSLRCSSFLCLYETLMYLIEMVLILVNSEDIKHSTHKLSFDERKESDEFATLLNSQAILTHLVLVRTHVSVDVCAWKMFILSTMHLIKMVRLHHEQPFPSFSSAQRTKGIRERSETSEIFHFGPFQW